MALSSVKRYIGLYSTPCLAPSAIGGLLWNPSTLAVYSLSCSLHFPQWALELVKYSLNSILLYSTLFYSILCSRIYSVQFLYFINFLHGNQAITCTQRSFIEYIHWSWIQWGISYLVRLVSRYVEQIQPTKLTSQTVSQEMNRSTKYLHCCTHCSCTYLYRLWVLIAVYINCTLQLQRLVAHTVHKWARMCTYTYAQVHSLVRTWLHALYAHMHCTGTKSHKIVVCIQKVHTKPGFVWPVHRASHTKLCFVYKKCIQNAVLCDFLLVRYARTYSMHTHVRTGAYICVYTCTVMSVRIRDHVNTHLCGGFYSRLKPPNQCLLVQTQLAEE